MEDTAAKVNFKNMRDIDISFYFLFFLMSSVVPANISELKNLEVLNMFNNQIEELPTQISSLQKLKHLNLG